LPKSKNGANAEARHKAREYLRKDAAFTAANITKEQWDAVVGPTMIHHIDAV